ncbi:MAG TPA: DUF4349 domain-containing protein [Allosphingosinicella sp.]|nr:DUF4349 domain-containing protein [Allosphingosinicella sp.]
MRLSIVIASLFIAACGGGSDVPMAAQDLQVPAGGMDGLPGIVADAAEPEPPEAAAAKIAYVYTMAYRLAAAAIPEAQRKHVALCDSLGAARCRIVSMSRDSSEGEFAQAALSLLVEARIARAFGDRLDEAVADAGGSVGSRGIEAEDLSKQMNDTAARIRGKQALAERLLVLLQNRSGKVGELVEAERAYAQAQEELDAARSWMAEMQQRVALSRVDIAYASNAPVGGGGWQPVRASLGRAGQVFGASVAALITIALAALPWLLALAMTVWAARRLGWLKRLRLPRWRRGRPQPATGDAADGGRA